MSYGGTFSQAFAQAHSDLGANDSFWWKGKEYSTNRADGRDLRAERLARKDNYSSNRYTSQPSYNSSYNDSIPTYHGSFSQAFSNAHNDMGGNNDFKWNNNIYSTNRADGRDLYQERMARDCCSNGNNWNNYTPSYNSNNTSGYISSRKISDQGQVPNIPVYGGTFNQAFASAHNDMGSNGTFEWKGRIYTTKRADGRDLRAEKGAIPTKWKDIIDNNSDNNDNSINSNNSNMHNSNSNSNSNNNWNVNNRNNDNDRDDNKYDGSIANDNNNDNARGDIIDRVFVIRSSFDQSVLNWLESNIRQYLIDKQVKIRLLAHSGLLLRTISGKWWKLDYTKSHGVKLVEIGYRCKENINFKTISTNHDRKYQEISIFDRRWEKQLNGSEPKFEKNVNWAYDKMKQLMKQPYCAVGAIKINTETCHKAQERLRRSLGIDIVNESTSWSLNDMLISIKDKLKNTLKRACDDNRVSLLAVLYKIFCD